MHRRSTDLKTSSSRRSRGFRRAGAALAALALITGGTSQTTRATTPDTEPTEPAATFPTDENPPDSVRMGIGGAGSFAFMTMYIAFNAGFLETELGELDVDVELVELEGSVAGIQGLVAGDVDYVASVTSTMLNAIAEGADIQQVATYLDSDLAVMLAPPGTSTAPEDLIGTRWGIPGFGSSAHVTALKVLANWGYTDADVELVPTGNVQASVAAVESGAADVYWLGIPVGEQFVQDGVLEVVLDMYDLETVQEVYGGPYMTAGVMSRTSFNEEHPAVTHAVVEATRQALEFVKDNADNPEAIAEFLPEGMRIEILPAVLDRVIAGQSPDGEISVEALENVIQASRDGEIIDASVEFNLEAVVTNAYR